MTAVDLAGTRYRATCNADAFDLGYKRILFHHALERVDHVDHEVQRCLGDEGPADDAAAAQFDQSFDGLGRVHDETGARRFDIYAVVGYEPGFASGCRGHMSFE